MIYNQQYSSPEWKSFIISSNSKDTFVFVKVDLSNASYTKKVINWNMINCWIVAVSKQNIMTCTTNFIYCTKL